MKSKIVSFFINGAGRPWCCKFGSSMTRGSEERVSQGAKLPFAARPVRTFPACPE